MAEVLSFYGEFSPSTIAIKSNSVKVVGDGFCELTDKGLRIQGFKDNRLSKIDWVNAIFWVLFSFVAGFFIFFFWLTGLGYAIGLIYLSKQKNKRGKRIDVLIPWRKIPFYSLDLAADQIIILHINRFRSRQETFDGKLFFYVDESRNPLDFLDFAEELMSYGVRPMP
ncbi:hypothetical protein PGN35_005975 [Nodosilinea sp. PGN35]|uniref:hypothetical protein n=1 Tax=Nodosilinea sp. PGN35 TaxID=3020489 RepID=UPI0023B30608|nr:hypothetical protein [Nodosilinea sp. TSF1-S3]MDF0367786.1 hypothetical protein [Nodosilinea sp. TSF1-S3]